MVTRRKPAGSAGTPSTRRRTTSRRTSRTSGASTGRRTTSRGRRGGTGRSTTRRRTPRTSTTLGSAFALALIALFTRASWPVRIGIVVVALVAVAGYLVLRARRPAADDELDASPDEDLEAPSEGPPDPSSPAPTEPKDSPS